MFEVTFTGLRERLQQLDSIERELPFATALALTRTIQEVKSALADEMKTAFDRPTRATLNSLYIQTATKQKLEASVWIKDGRNRTTSGNIVGREGVWGKGRAASKWLEPQVRGGQRGQKGFERRLERSGVLAPGQYVVPAKSTKLDAYGNIGQGQLNKMLSGAGVLSGAGYDANATGSARSAAKGNRRFFIIRKGSRPIGIAERLSYGEGSRNNIRMALAFVRRPSYRPDFDFFGVAERTANETLPIEFEKALEQALATRRR